MCISSVIDNIVKSGKSVSWFYRWPILDFGKMLSTPIGTGTIEIAGPQKLVQDNHVMHALLSGHRDLI